MVSQNAIPSKSYLGGSFPYAFTEHGVLMLANVLKSDKAVKVSVKIIELFVKPRQSMVNHTELRLEIEKIKKKVDSQDKNIKIVFRYFDELLLNKLDDARELIGYKVRQKKEDRIIYQSRKPGITTKTKRKR